MHLLNNALWLQLGKQYYTGMYLLSIKVLTGFSFIFLLHCLPRGPQAAHLCGIIEVDGRYDTRLPALGAVIAALAAAAAGG